MPTIQDATIELHRCFHLLNEHFYGGLLTEPAITIQSKGKRNALGWFTLDEIWQNENGSIRKFEINLSAEHLNRGTTEIMQTLLHEMVHLHCRVNGIKDSSRGGTYHNKRFKEASESHGFFYDEAPHPTHGWTFSKLTPETVELFNSFRFDESAFGIARFDPKKTLKARNSFKLVCYECGLILRATKPGIRVLCKECGIELTETN